MASQRATHKRRIIISDKRAKIVVGDGYLEVKGVLDEIVVGFFRSEEIYIHKDIELKISDLYTISKHLKTYLIDSYGNIIANFRRC